MKIFGDAFGGVSTETVGKRKAFITFVGTKGKALTDVIVASAPMTAVQIGQKVDYSITKALGKDFLISAFGDQPVVITIDGMSIYAPDSTSHTADAKAIPTFYKNNRLSTDINNRVQVGIAGLAGGAQAFSCAIISLELSATSAASVSGMCGYKLVMIGVEL